MEHGKEQKYQSQVSYDTLTNNCSILLAGKLEVPELTRSSTLIRWEEFLYLSQIKRVVNHSVSHDSILFQFYFSGKDLIQD